MNKKRLGQLLIGAVFSGCALVIAALAELVTKETEKAPGDQDRRS